MKRVLACFLIAVILSVFLAVVSAFATTRGIRVKAKSSAGGIQEIPLYSDYYALVIGCEK